ncbi:trypsin-like peptidase domain-containing protein [Streptomyces sp. NPDC087903]|uniref:trypsin-like peptidase domain-containing protein n=1 Tax=Streptomyces sp. NPDC087903 TaxID=3365819 RepID=UPI00381DAE12
MAARGPRTGGGHRTPEGVRAARDSSGAGRTRHGTGTFQDPASRTGGFADETRHPRERARRPRDDEQAGGLDPSRDAVRSRSDGDPTRDRDDRSRQPRDEAVVRVHDLAGRPRGAGFVADHHGTVITSHEAVDGLRRLVLRTADDRSCVVTADEVTPLPALDLALVRTRGLGVDPLPVTARDRIDTGTYVHIAAGCWREARVLGATDVTYTATDRFHQLGDALELAIGTAGRDALRLGGGAAGGPVLDAVTGAVIGLLGTALQCGHRDTGFAVPLRRAQGPLAELLAVNAATVPAYGVDLNLAGVRELTATSVAQDGPPGLPAAGAGDGEPGVVEPVERADVTAEFTAFLHGPAAVLGLVGAPGSGRTTELAALAARRDRSAEPAPTLWLRGADLKDDDSSVADAAGRALTRAARIVAASRSARPADLGDLTPHRLARLAHTAGRPLLLLLDSPEEMPPALAHRLPDWTAGTAEWLLETGTRLVVACRAEYWEEAGAGFPAESVHGGRAGDLTAPTPMRTAPPAPPHLHLGDLREHEARRARARYGIPETAVSAADARHPLTLRLLSEVRAALPETTEPPGQPGARVDRDEVFSAHLDLMCLRIAVRLAAVGGLRGTAVRRLAAKVSGQVHEAARRSLGPGPGELDPALFEMLFPWGPAPARLGGGTGWASAVLTEGLLVPAGGGYRFGHEELADWLQGMHLDLDEALRALVLRRTPPHDTHPHPVPHHRLGSVVEALLLLARQQGTPQLALRLEELVYALEVDPYSWWTVRLITGTLSRVADATPYADVLRLLADRLVDRGQRDRPLPAEFGPAFWTALPLPDDIRFDLLRRLVLADGPPTPPAAPHDTAPPRFLDAVASLLAAEPTAVQPHLVRWFDDERPLPATPHATVAQAAQALLHTHRHRALDDLTEALVDSVHPGADELLAVLAEDEPSAVCRAVDRWAHDARPTRRAAAVTQALRAAPRLRTDADRELLRHAALTLLTRPADRPLHGRALALLVRDPHTRARHLPQALAHFAACDPGFPPSALVAALPTHQEPVLDAFRARLRRPDAQAALRTLADVTTPALAGRVAALVREAVEEHPETAVHLAAYLDRRLDQGPAARPVLLPLVTGLLQGGPQPARAALAAVLAAPGTPASRPLRHELLDVLLAHERHPAVLEALLRTAVEGATARDTAGLRDLVHRTGLLLVRTPDGATRFDCGLVDLARQVPGFAARVAGWLSDAPGEWAAVVGPSARRMIENLAGVRVPA